MIDRWLYGVVGFCLFLKYFLLFFLLVDTMARAFICGGYSSGVEHNLAKVGVEGSNPFTRSMSWCMSV